MRVFSISICEIIVLAHFLVAQEGLPAELAAREARVFFFDEMVQLSRGDDEDYIKNKSSEVFVEHEIPYPKSYVDATTELWKALYRISRDTIGKPSDADKQKLLEQAASYTDILLESILERTREFPRVQEEIDREVLSEARSYALNRLEFSINDPFQVGIKHPLPEERFRFYLNNVRKFEQTILSDDLLEAWEQELDPPVWDGPSVISAQHKQRQRDFLIAGKRAQIRNYLQLTLSTYGMEEAQHLSQLIPEDKFGAMLLEERLFQTKLTTPEMDLSASTDHSEKVDADKSLATR